MCPCFAWYDWESFVGFWCWMPPVLVANGRDRVATLLQ
jgi:hypothetical protein